jgi:predicted permease
MTALLQDARVAIRTLAKSPGFAAVAVLSLALGIGGNTAIFSLINALLLRDLDVRQPERLVELYAVRRTGPVPFSYPMFRELERGQRVFSGLMGWSSGVTSTVDLNGSLFETSKNSVTGNYYEELGVAPLVGRLITQADYNSGSPAPVAVLDYDFWQSRFGGARAVLGRPISIDAESYTIIGVTKKWFTGMTPGEPPQITVPLKATDNRAMLFVSVTGRLKDGMSIAAARAQLRSLWPAVLLATASTDIPGPRRQAFLSMDLEVAGVATGVARDLRARFARPLYVLLGIVGLILLVACVNLSNLMLSRAAARSHETSVRLALGAGRWAVARPVIAESLTLSGAGALVGFAFAYWGSRSLVGLMTEGYLSPVTLDLDPDWRVLALTAAVAILTGLLFAVAPVFRLWREDPASALQQNARSVTGATGGLGRALMIAQIALSLVVLLGAGLLARSFQKLLSIDPGFETRVLAEGLHQKPGGYRNLNLAAYHEQLVRQVASLPQVTSAGFSNFSGPGRWSWQDAASATADASNPASGVMTSAITVTPGFFRTLGIGLLRGRDFEWTDDEHHPQVTIISDSLAKRIFPSGDAIGRRIRFGVMPELQGLEVVGVASDARLFNLRDGAAAALYRPESQDPGGTEGGSLFIRTRQSSGAVKVNESVKREIESLGRDFVTSTTTLQEAVSEALQEERLVAALAGCFGVLAVLLASIGVYGLASYSVICRTREIGIRAALGARPSVIRRALLRDALVVALAGEAIGIPCGLIATRLLAGTLFGVSTHDLTSLALASLILLASALLAGYIPARRAAKIDPMVALRAE